MKKKPTKVQVLDALQTHKTVDKAAKALGISYPVMQKLLRQYDIQIIMDGGRSQGKSAALCEWLKHLTTNIKIGKV